ncbi:MAG: hypothetical protein HY343_11155 [Lentisphaerae bacterium]|nr:hypothetical protein [Lentisphaerota bacterium]
MKLDANHPMNRLVLRYLSRDAKKEAPALAAPGSVRDAYYGQGSHPDIVERVWDQIGKALPLKCRCLVYGTPALVHPNSGIVFAICNGTQYNLRLTPAALGEALQQGAKTVTRWSGGEEMNAVEVLGPDWVFGLWSKDESRWCRAICEALADVSKEKPG